MSHLVLSPKSDTQGSEPSAVGFTGTREGATGHQLDSFSAWAVRRGHGTFHHGLCVGWDALAHQHLKALGWHIVGHPGDVPARLRAPITDCDEMRPVKPPLVRNAEIVIETSELVACVAGPEVLRSGTWSTVRKARALRRPVTIFWPDGNVTTENHPSAYRCTRCGRDEIDGRNNGCLRGPCPMEFVG